MTKKEIKKEIKNKALPCDRIVDWDFHECMGELLVYIIKITPHHNVIKEIYEVYEVSGETVINIFDSIIL